jgi:hypothetical protein
MAKLTPAVAEHGAGVAAGERDDVGAGDAPGALLLERRLGRVYDLEAAQARVVGRGQLLRLRVSRGRVEQHGRVAALTN